MPLAWFKIFYSIYIHIRAEGTIKKQSEVNSRISDWAVCKKGEALTGSKEFEIGDISKR